MFIESSLKLNEKMRGQRKFVYVPFQIRILRFSRVVVITGNFGNVCNRERLSSDFRLKSPAGNASDKSFCDDSEYAREKRYYRLFSK